MRSTEVGLYLRHLSERPGGISMATLHQRLTVARLFHGYLMEEGLAARNPVARGIRGKAGLTGIGRRTAVLVRQQPLPWIPGEEDWLAILQVARALPLRTRFMLALAYDAALRREELCKLATDDFDPARRMLRVRAENTKGRRERVVPYSQVTGELFSVYLAERRGLSRDRGPLFLSTSRRNRARPLTIWTWSKVVADIAKAAGVRRFTTHTLRHLCLTDCARKGWDINEIATFAGHRSLQTTARYIHLSGRDLAEKVARGMAQLHASRLELLKGDR